ncbi:MAG: flap endonuclease-1 [Methanobacteriaceae archaeon]
MGVKFKDIVNPQNINFKDLNGRIIAIDAANSIYQFLSSIRQRDGTPLMDDNGNVTSHLSGILYRTSNIVEKGIKPIYVFDGKSSHLKRDTINKRINVREESEKKWKESLEKGDIEEARKFAVRSSRMSSYTIESSKKLLEFMGIPYVQSFGEGEAQASYMVANGDAWAVASQDYDCLLFGAPKIIRNLTLSGNLSDLEYMELKKTINALDLTRKQLVDLALLVGTDFNEGIKGIGAKKGLKLIKTHETAEKALESINEELVVTGDATINDLRNIFLEPNINTKYEIKWKSPENDKLTEFMCDVHNFSVDRVLSASKRMKSLKTTQKSLEDWF